MSRAAKQLPLFSPEPSKSEPPQPTFPNDPWLASSALQKAIRRGDAEIASAAIAALHRLRGASVWSRMLVIAFEDIGPAAPDVLVEAVTGSTQPKWRHLAGGNACAAQLLARMMARAPKDRSADHLICCARSHPSAAQVRQRLTGSPIAARIQMALDQSLPILERAAAAWYASGVEWGQESRVGPGDIDALLLAFEGAGVPRPVLDATRIAAKRTREPITIMAPVLWQVIKSDRWARVVNCDVPAAPTIYGVPAYAMDVHTRSGRRAIDMFAEQCQPVRAVFEMRVLRRHRREAAHLAAFYSDAASVALRLLWSGADELERLGIENDFIGLGVQPEAVPELLAVVRAHLEHLNAIRAEVLTEVLGLSNTGGIE